VSIGDKSQLDSYLLELHIILHVVDYFALFFIIKVYIKAINCNGWFHYIANKRQANILFCELIQA